MKKEDATSEYANYLRKHFNIPGRIESSKVICTMEKSSQEKEIEDHEDSSGDNKDVPPDSQKIQKEPNLERTGN
ncbi:Hypothetical protein FKW44_025399 [Caligus rogercresseyi]|uniref:Uncharacterized protein n=1 Tax=Caligus rogercresseyi TaxID=217165 RepID=A0A7T8GL89_CALRO|nr:Hypothetical protein FKW44_025399 [Caligus rogercresseyi]